MTGSVVSEGRLGLKFERIRPKIQEQMLILAHAMLFPAKISPHMLKTFHSFFGK